MRTIVVGSRTFTDYDALKMVLDNPPWEITEIVSGGARGADSLGERWATENGVECSVFHPNWSIGRQAGIIRNIEMAKYAEALIAFWDGESRGTKHMIEEAKKRKLKVFVVRGL